MSTESAANLTRSIVQVEAFVPPETEALVRMSAEQTGTDLSVEENLLHVRMLRLIATERRRERASDWAELQQQTEPADLPGRTAWNYAWNADWEFTGARREHVMRQYPLQIRAAGRTVMTLVAEQQIDERGEPLATPAGGAVELIPFSRVATGHADESHLIARHLRLSGLHTAGRTRPGGAFNDWQYPSEARDYLRVYPVAPGFGEGEMDRQQMRSFGASDNLLNRIIRERSIYPVARMFEGRGAREVEGFTRPDVDAINQEVQNIEPIHADEITVRELFRHIGSEKMGEEALRLSGAANHYRRLPGQGRGRCIRLRSTTRVINTYNWMTTLQPGEAGADELAELLSYDSVHMHEFIIRADHARGRDLYPTARGPRRRVYPPAVVRQILARFRDRMHVDAGVPDIFPQYRPPKRPVELLWWPASETDQEAWEPPVPAASAEETPAEVVAPASEQPRAPRRRAKRAYVAAGAAGAVVLAETEPAPAADTVPVADATAVIAATTPVESVATEAEVVAVADEPQVADMPETYQPPEPEWRTYANLASILRVPLSEIMNSIRRTQPAPEHIQPRPTESGDYKPHVHPQVAAQAAYTVLRQRRQRMPSSQFTTLQIALLAGLHPSDVARRIRDAQIDSTNHAKPETATYGRTELDQILNILGVSF